MNILCLQETDWLTRGPHTQHHVLERLSKNFNINITVLDYDISKNIRSKFPFIKKQVFSNIHRTLKNSNVLIIRTSHIQIPYIRRISSLITNFFEILRLIKTRRPDIIISFSISNGIIGLFLAKIFRIPFIFFYIDLIHSLVPFSYLQNFARSITRYMFKNSDRVIAVTKALKNFAINEGTSPEKVTVLLNGISLENTIVNTERLEQLRTKFSIRNNEFVILYMGYLYDFAGLKEIIDYYNSDVIKGKFNIKFLIVGDGGIYNYLTSYVKRIKADWVILTGKVPFSKTTEYIELANLCLMSFKLNNITKYITPVKVMEYMAMKKPVLSNYLPSIAFEIGDNNGVIFAKNQRDLIKMIRNFISKKKELTEIGKRGYELIKLKYDWKEIYKKFKKIILDLIISKRD